MDFELHASKTAGRSRYPRGVDGNPKFKIENSKLARDAELGRDLPNLRFFRTPNPAIGCSTL
jgi:hypothetical protein